MIRCSQCGTDNRDGSEYCTNCGAELQGMPAVACPSCGAMNPAHNILCSECLSHLAPLDTSDTESSDGTSVDEHGPEPDLGSTALLHRDDGAPESEEPLLPPADTAPSQPYASEEEAEGFEPGEPLSTASRGLPLENIMALPHRSEGPSHGPVPLELHEQAEALIDVLDVPRLGEEVRSVVADRQIALPGKATRSWLYALLIAALVVPLLLGNQWFGASVSSRPAVSGLFQTIQALAPDSTVLLAFDYDPGTADELAPGVSAILDHLLRQQVSLLAVSAVPTGPLMAWQQIEQAAERGGGRVYGDDYLLLGYLPGEESALRRISDGPSLAFSVDYIEGKPVHEFSLGQRSESLEDVALTLIFSGDAPHVRRWLEQVQAHSGSPFGAVVSAAAEPGLTPYYASGQLRGVVAGLPGAAEYEAASASAGSALGSSDAQAMAYLVIALSALWGNLHHLFSRREPRA